ncbi:hypothetical protein ABZY57_17485 [Streptomyces sp. NPDC006450]|uniref:hypothetical protein n=1 Tax=Streptomyces sp. NPDC006450 TaxID=3155458 RepID=UPI0033AFF551
MPHAPRTRRLAVLTATAALAAAGGLLPSSAFAAPATPHADTVTAAAPGHDGRGDQRIGSCHWHSVGGDHGKRKGHDPGWGWWHCHKHGHGHKHGHKDGHDKDRRRDNDRWRDADRWRDVDRWLDIGRWYNDGRVHGT